jgi:hypothetical protein
MRRILFLPLILFAALSRPLASQTPGLPPKVCPSDFTDGPLYDGGIARYGIPARKIVEGWLAPPHDSFGRTESGTQNVRVSTLRVLADQTDASACLRLTTILTHGQRSAPAFRTWVYFTAGGFYFVSQWKPAQLLSNYTTSYGHVIVFDSAFNLRGVYAF